ncbi:MAG: hypothetical protein ABIE70_01595 [bacterium]
MQYPRKISRLLEPITASRHLRSHSLLIVMCGLLIGSNVPAREVASDLPAYCTVVHNVGKMKLGVTNFGQLGAGSDHDCLTNERIYASCEYPKDSRLEYWGLSALWVGAVVGRDTLVSTGTSGWGPMGFEMSPDVSPFGDFEVRSINDPDPEKSRIAVSEQDFICTYTDTQDALTYPSWDVLDHRYHKPLMVEITQHSYAWSYAYAEDFVLFDFKLTNFSENTWEDMYLALFASPLCGFGGGEVVGFRRTAPSWLGCGYEDTLNLAWAADNDGDPIDGEWVEPVRRLPPPAIGYEGSARSIVGVRILEPPSEFLEMSYNWWLSHGLDKTRDWGPRHKSDTRGILYGGNGTPLGDRMLYHFMRNHEFDPPQTEMVYILPSDTLWQAPRMDLAPEFAKGGKASFLLSYGAFSRMEPGEGTSIAFAFICGEHFHNDPTNGDNLPYRPDQWMSGVDFSDLDKNALWAGWIYDNPGVDTDGDGYFGEYRACDYDSIETDSGWVITAADTTWYRGDGVPDWRGAGPPPAPYIYVEPVYQGLRVRFNGERSETEKDIFSHMVDFEGYRIYLGRDERYASLAMIASYDHHNYDKYVWNNKGVPSPGWELREVPYTLRELRCLYGSGDDPCSDDEFDPLDYDRNHWFTHPDFPDTVMFFTAHDFNASEFGTTTPVRKVYPEARDPRTVSPEQLTDDDYTAEGHFKFFEYEFVVNDLLSTVPYSINVTAFDFGSPNSGLDALETSRVNGIITSYPAGSEAIASGADDKVYVYPNPYRIDGDYRDQGFEGRDRPDLPDFRTRLVHFANVPPKCTIRIHTLDGDLVRRIDHNLSDADPLSNHATWNLISRNHQLVVTGLYYWTVESPGRPTQIGKLVIIK